MELAGELHDICGVLQHECSRHDQIRVQPHETEVDVGEAAHSGRSVPHLPWYAQVQAPESSDQITAGIMLARITPPHTKGGEVQAGTPGVLKIEMLLLAARWHACQPVVCLVRRHAPPRRQGTARRLITAFRLPVVPPAGHRLKRRRSAHQRLCCRRFHWQSAGIAASCLLSLLSGPRITHFLPAMARKRHSRRCGGQSRRRLATRAGCEPRAATAAQLSKST